jgi:hypothetical protein
MYRDQLLRALGTQFSALSTAPCSPRSDAVMRARRGAPISSPPAWRGAQMRPKPEQLPM